jgi:hypothetical protein
MMGKSESWKGAYQLSKCRKIEIKGIKEGHAAKK